MEIATAQTALTFSCFIALLAVGQCAIPLHLRHGLNSVLPLEAPPLGSYRYEFRSVHHSSHGGGGDHDNSTENPLNDIITNLHKLESMFFGNSSFFHSFNRKNRRNRTRLSFPKWFNSWPDFDDSSSEEGEEGTTDDPCGGGFFDFSDFDSIIMEIKTEIEEFFNDMNSIFPNFHGEKNTTDSSGEDWADEFLDDIKKSFGKKPQDRDREPVERLQAQKGNKKEEKPKETAKEPVENKEITTPTTVENKN